MSGAGQTPISVSRKRWIGWIAGTVTTALVVTFAVVASGFDSRETPREDPSVWVERVAGQYARVNTETAEIDTVRAAESPSGVVQTRDLGVLLTQGFGRAWQIDPADPIDFQVDGAEADASDSVETPTVTSTATAEASGAASAEASGAASEEDSNGAMRTPDGTRQVMAAGDHLLFFTQNGEAHISTVEPAAAGAQPQLSAPRLLDPLAEERAEAEKKRAEAAATSQDGSDSEGDGSAEPVADGADEAELLQYVADAAAIDEDGTVAIFSKAEQSIRWFDQALDEWRGTSDVPEEVPAEGVQLAILEDKWTLLDTDGNLWMQDRADPVQIEFTGEARLQASTATQSADVLIADDGGLWSVSDDGEAQRTVEANGTAAQPRYVDGEAVAAWVGAAGAQVWTSDAGEMTLELDETVEDLSTVEPEVRSNGSRAVIVERRSGMMWTVPDGKLIPVVQWSLVDPPKQESGTVVTQDVAEQEPPVAVNDSFGVRPGEPTLLPVLLNDYDPNRRDVLTVVTEGLGEGLNSDFGSLSALSDGQGLVLQPTPDASGSATFSYRITDGVSVSQPATVTMTVADESTNTAPQWCAVEGCQRSWPNPELAPGGTLILPILEGWVDPEGDPMMLMQAVVVNSDDPMRALVTDDGKLAVRHTDSNAPASDSVVRLTAVDSRGAETERDLRIRVRTGAAIEFTSAAATAQVGEPMTLRPLERVTGGSGSFQLIDATVQQGSLTVTANQGRGTIEVTASAPGNALVGVTVRDTITEQETTGVIRVTSVEGRNSFAVPPLRAFVRPLADSTIDVLAAVPGANSRALTVRSATVNEGQLRADVIEHSRVRVSGSTPDGQPGRIGAVDVVIAEDEVTAQGRMTVFQVADSSAAAIAVTDTATVRAGSVVDIPVLENDVAPAGERLVLHPEVGAPGIEGELAFASGSNVRYLAPEQPGTYNLSYTTYGASTPEQSDVGQVRVTVLDAGANRDPQPATVTVRVAPGERVNSVIPLSGVDPDGDRLRLVSIDAPGDAQLSASIVPRTNSVQVEASTNAQRGTQAIGYTVRDSFGGEAKGRLRIIVTEPDPGGGAPVVYSDYVRIARSATDAAVVRPLDNDLDPTGGTLKLVSVEPNVPDGKDSPLYRELASRLDLSEMKKGIVRVTGSGELGTVSYKYTVRSDKSKSTADGLIVVQVSERIGQQAPSVIDTVLSVRDRADFERAGVDVITERVRWASGDIATLKLSLWGSALRDYKVQGSNITGKYKASGDLVPFKLSGVDMTGAEVETFGFLIVPPLDELRLSLKSSLAPISVEENKSIDLRVADLLDLGSGDRVELDSAPFGVQRSQASCVAVSDTTIRYSAGREAPWNDNCSIRVRLVEQNTYTLLPVPIVIVPDEPAVQLNPLTRTVAPGQSESINLVDMVEWQGGREGQITQLRWQVSGGGSSFEVNSSGGQVQATARADAIPGSQETLTVNASGAGDSQSVLTLRVGEAPVDAPRGGTVSLQCTVGASCSTSLIGLNGEHDPFAGKPGGGLQLVSVEAGGCQQFGSMQASGDSVSVSWADAGGPGGRCTASFTVRDAQKRTGTGEIEFDAQGLPHAPTQIVPTGATETNVTLTVSLSTQSSHPEVTGVEVLHEGSVVGNCSPSASAAVCTVNAPIGKDNERQYTARSVNSVGPSTQTTPSDATWAYRAPAAPDVSAEPIRDSSNTSQTEGKLRLNVSGSTRANYFELKIGDQAPIEVSRGNSIHTLAPGSHSLSVTPQDTNQPPNYSGSAEGTAWTGTVLIGAAPILSNVTLVPTGDTSARVEYTVDENYPGTSSSELRFGFGVQGGSLPSCSSSDSERDFGASGRYKTYVGVVCAQTDFGRTTVQTNAVWIGGNPPDLGVTRGYTIGGQVSDYGNTREYTTVGSGGSQPAVSGAVNGATIRYVLSNGSTSDISLGSVPVGATVQVQQCLSGAGNEYCSNPVPVGAAGNLPTRISWNGVCVVDGGDYSSVFTVEGQAISDATFAKQGSRNVRVTWASTFNDTTFNNAICEAAPEPEPEPEPVPGDPGSG